jgi:hypothetical protein
MRPSSCAAKCRLAIAHRIQPRIGRLKLSDRWLDWRGWLALLWVLWWGWSYALMTFQARGPQVLAWLRTIWR